MVLAVNSYVYLNGFLRLPGNRMTWLSIGPPDGAQVFISGFEVG